MPRNEDRRRMLADAGLAVLAGEGARGLTHRAVDRRAGVPAGTTSNYFRSRAALIGALVGRIAERLAPDPAVLAELGQRRPDRALFADYLRDVVARLLGARDVTLALLELRLEATRRPEVAEALTEWQRRAFAADVEFNLRARLPGSAADIALFHYAIDGLILDAVTTSIDPTTDPDHVVGTLVERLLP